MNSHSRINDMEYFYKNRNKTKAIGNEGLFGSDEDMEIFCELEFDGACSIRLMSQPPTEKQQKEFDKSQYIITDNGFYYFNINAEENKLEKIALDQEKLNKLRDYFFKIDEKIAKNEKEVKKILSSEQLEYIELMTDHAIGNREWEENKRLLERQIDVINKIKERLEYENKTYYIEDKILQYDKRITQLEDRIAGRIKPETSVFQDIEEWVKWLRKFKSPGEFFVHIGKKLPGFLISLQVWFTSARLFLLRTNRLSFLSTGTKFEEYSKFIRIGGLSYGLSLLIRLCEFIYYPLIKPLYLCFFKPFYSCVIKPFINVDINEKDFSLWGILKKRFKALSEYYQNVDYISFWERAKSGFKALCEEKDLLWNIANDLVWFSINLAGILVTGGWSLVITGIINVTGFAFDFCNESLQAWILHLKYKFYINYTAKLITELENSDRRLLNKDEISLLTKIKNKSISKKEADMWTRARLVIGALITVGGMFLVFFPPAIIPFATIIGASCALFGGSTMTGFSMRIYNLGKDFCTYVVKKWNWKPPKESEAINNMESKEHVDIANDVYVPLATTTKIVHELLDKTKSKKHLNRDSDIDTTDSDTDEASEDGSHTAGSDPIIYKMCTSLSSSASDEHQPLAKTKEFIPEIIQNMEKKGGVVVHNKSVGESGARPRASSYSNSGEHQLFVKPKKVISEKIQNKEEKAEVVVDKSEILPEASAARTLFTRPRSSSFQQFIAAKANEPSLVTVGGHANFNQC